ncbi:MAG TPA: NUDIX domain-containing protein, partial [Dongiaceae bacterium]|nr:NUDIX domain-containing protein [Dongiaceae bacterium]
YKRPQKGIWGGLWSFPEFESADVLKETLALEGTARRAKLQEWAPFRHTFSHYHLDIHPVQVQLAKRPNKVGESGLVAGSEQVWYNRRLIEGLGLAAPVRKLIDQLLQESP